MTMANMPPTAKAKHQKLIDPEVVYTEPDNRRASGNEEDNDFEAEVEFKTEAEVLSNNPYSTISKSKRALYNKSATTKAKTDGKFPFLKLPPEVRNMIYRYVVVSKSPNPIDLGTSNWFERGGIQTSILVLNRQISLEACSILYKENKFIARGTRAIAFRGDKKMTVQRTARSLRSGRTVDMLSHHGLIYRHVALRLDNIEFDIEVLNRVQNSDGYTWLSAFRTKYRIQAILEFVHSRPKIQGQTPWKLTIKATIPKKGRQVYQGICRTVFEKAYSPLLRGKTMRLVESGAFTIHIEGKFASGIKNLISQIYKRVLHNGMHTEKMFILEDHRVRRILFAPYEIIEEGTTNSLRFWTDVVGLLFHKVDSGTAEDLYNQINIFFFTNFY